jgi:hypothetical protein
MKMTKFLAGAFLLAGGAAFADDDGFSLKNNPSFDVVEASDLEVLKDGGPAVNVLDAQDLAVGEQADSNGAEHDYVLEVVDASDLEVIPRGGPMLRVLDASDIQLFARSRKGEYVESRARAAERIDVTTPAPAADVDVDVDTYDTDVHIRKNF